MKGLCGSGGRFTVAGRCRHQYVTSGKTGIQYITKMKTVLIYAYLLIIVVQHSSNNNMGNSSSVVALDTQMEKIKTYPLYPQGVTNNCSKSYKIFRFGNVLVLIVLREQGRITSFGFAAGQTCL